MTQKNPETQVGFRAEIVVLTLAECPQTRRGAMRIMTMLELDDMDVS
jgi:hypothetical protein